jgi:predicted transcriptional regulator of viral defense system
MSLSIPTKNNNSPSERILAVARSNGILRPRDVAALGIAPVYIQRLVACGLLVRSGRGLYGLPDADVTEHHSLAEANKRVSHSVICLLSALRFHGLTTQAPFEVWSAIDHKARAPKIDFPPIHIVRMSGNFLKKYVEVHRIEGVEVQIFSAAKTVTDCFRYRNKIGLDVAIEALRDYLRQKYSIDDLWHCAEAGRITRVIRPYMEAMV